MQERLCQRECVCVCVCVCVCFLCCKYKDRVCFFSPLSAAAALTDLFLTRQRMTHSASWMERSASSITSLLEPRTTMLTVFPGLVQPVICMERQEGGLTVIPGHLRFTPPENCHSNCDNYLGCWSLTSAWMRTLTSLPEPSRLTSSTSSAVPSISGVKWSMWAMGLVPRV